MEILHKNLVKEDGKPDRTEEILVPLKVKFNNYAIEQLTAVKGAGGGFYGFTTAIVWGGYLGYCFAQQIDPVLTFEEITDWVDEGHTEELNQIAADFRASKSYEKMIKKTAKEEAPQEKGESGTESISLPGEESGLNHENITV
jgi:hypothetical protein